MIEWSSKSGFFLIHNIIYHQLLWFVNRVYQIIFELNHDYIQYQVTYSIKVLFNDNFFVPITITWELYHLLRELFLCSLCTFTGRIPSRFNIGIMLFASCFVSYMLRVNFSINILAMVQQQETEANNGEKSDVTIEPDVSIVRFSVHLYWSFIAHIFLAKNVDCSYK